MRRKPQYTMNVRHLSGEHGGRLGSRVNAAGLDGDDEMAAVLEEVVCVEGHDLCLLSGQMKPNVCGRDRTWLGCATSAKITSTMPTSMRYLCGWRASSMMGMMLVRFLATLMRSRPLRCENSTAYTRPSCKCIKRLYSFQQQYERVPGQQCQTRARRWYQRLHRGTAPKENVRKMCSFVFEKRNQKQRVSTDLCARLDVDGCNTAKDGSGQLAAEGVPCAVLDFGVTRLKYWRHIAEAHTSMRYVRRR